LLSLTTFSKLAPTEISAAFTFSNAIFNLFAGIRAYFAGLVDAELTLEINGAAWSHHFHYMAVASGH
jgi:hypothetical protein